MKANKICNFILIAVFVLLLTVPTVLWLSSGRFSADEGLDEKRTLAAFPDHLSSSILSEAETWYSDHAPYRNCLITFQKEVMQSYQSLYRSHIHPYASRLFTPAWYDSTSQPYLAPLYVNDCGFVIYGKEDWLFLEAESNMDYYIGSNVLSKDEMAVWKNIYESLAEKCAERNITLAVFITPTKEEIYSEYMPSYAVLSDKRRAEVFSEYMRLNSDVTYVYPFSEFIAAKESGEIYYRQDTHWNCLGAYDGLREIYSALQFPLAGSDEIYFWTGEKTGGDLGDISGYRTTYTDYSVLYRPKAQVRTRAVEDTTLTVSESDIPLFDKKLFLVADSMAGSISPYLTKDFSETFITNYTNEKDPAHPEYQKILDSLSDGDVLLLLAAERNDEWIVRTAEQLCTRLE